MSKRVVIGIYYDNESDRCFKVGPRVASISEGEIEGVGGMCAVYNVWEDGESLTAVVPAWKVTAMYDTKEAAALLRKDAS